MGRPFERRARRRGRGRTLRPQGFARQRRARDPARVYDGRLEDRPMGARWALRWTALAAASGGRGPSPAVAPATRPTAPRAHTINSLIDEILPRLVHDNWRVREAAEAELADLGELAVPRLRALVAAPAQPEMRDRAHSA